MLYFFDVLRSCANYSFANYIVKQIISSDGKLRLMIFFNIFEQPLAYDP